MSDLQLGTYVAIKGVMEKITTDNYFDAAQALYWICVEWHGGQNSMLYRVQSQLDYHPGMGESVELMLEADEFMGAAGFYAELNALGEAKKFDELDEVAEQMLIDIQKAYDKASA